MYFALADRTNLQYTPFSNLQPVLSLKQSKITSAVKKKENAGLSCKPSSPAAPEHQLYDALAHQVRWLLVDFVTKSAPLLDLIIGRFLVLFVGRYK